MKTLMQLLLVTYAVMGIAHASIGRWKFVALSVAGVAVTAYIIKTEEA